MNNQIYQRFLHSIFYKQNQWNQFKLFQDVILREIIAIAQFLQTFRFPIQYCFLYFILHISIHTHLNCFVSNSFPKTTSHEEKSQALTIINALTYLHDQHIAHRDLKPENIVLSSKGMAELCDFGWSTVVEQLRSTFCGTLDYAPPEILQEKQYDWSVDVWCLGILAYQLLIGHAPFQFNDRQKKMQNIVNIDKTGLPGLDQIPQQAKEFVKALLQKNPQNRPKIAQLLDFRLFVDVLRRHKHSD